MSLIVGVRAVRTEAGDGEFFCPVCGGDRRYRRGTGRRWLIVLGAPLIPVGRTGDEVRCAVCATGHRARVLDVPTGRRLTRMLRDTTRALVVGSLAAGGGEPSGLGRAAAIEAVRAVGVTGYTDELLGADLASHRDEDLHAVTAALAVHLEPEGRARLLQVAAQVSVASGVIGDIEHGWLHEAGSRLGMTRGMVDFVLDSARNSPL